MSLTNEERQTLVQRELSKAHEAYEDIEILKASKRWNGAANRLYYAVFHAVNALFINDGLEAGRHKTSHSLFSLHYVKTGLLPIEYGRLYNNLQRLREKSDYNCFFDVSEKDIETFPLASNKREAVPIDVAGFPLLFLTSLTTLFVFLYLRIHHKDISIMVTKDVPRN